MVFGFFSRKAAPPQEPAEAGPSAVNAPSPAANTGSVVSPEFRFPPVKQQHTPAPSIDSPAAFTNQEADAQPAPKPKKPRAKPGPKSKPKPVVKETSPLISEIPAGPADTPSPGPEDALVTDPNALYSLISSVPAQTLHFYTLAHLNPSPPSALPLGITSPAPIIPPTPEILTALTTFYSHLAPPPKLHCVRCHRGYFELENGDTACRVAHDDESAIVQRVGTNSQNSRALHETLWGCCGSTVDGDGDQGPPDGWCYEGAHTVRLLSTVLNFLSILPQFFLSTFKSNAPVKFIFSASQFCFRNCANNAFDRLFITPDRCQARTLPCRLDNARRYADLLCANAMRDACSQLGLSFN